MQLQLHTKLFKGRNFILNNRELPQLHAKAKQAAFLRCHCPPSAVIWGTHGHCMLFTSLLPLIFQKPLAAGPPGGQTFRAAGATTPHIRLPLDFLNGGLCRLVSEETAQSKCLRHLKLWKTILFVKNIPILGFIYFYLYIYIFLLIDINNQQTWNTLRLKKQRPNPPSLAEGVAPPSHHLVTSVVKSEHKQWREEKAWTTPGMVY